jgi:DNA-binding NarL/FixJ family response regulator
VEQEQVTEHPSIPSRIVIADGHPLFRSALRRLLEESPEMEVVAEAADGQEALELCRRFRPELVLMDVIMPTMDGIAATRAIKAELPRTIVLVMTASESMEHLAEALRAGVGGYILKSASPQQTTDAVRRVLEGEFSINQQVAMRLLVHLTNERRAEQEPVGQVPEVLSKEGRTTPSALDRELSPREVEVLRLIAHGYTNQQIAKELLLSNSTVKNHVQRILSKLGASGRTQAAIMAIEIGLLSNL